MVITLDEAAFVGLLSGQVVRTNTLVGESVRFQLEDSSWLAILKAIETANQKRQPPAE